MRIGRESEVVVVEPVEEPVPVSTPEPIEPSEPKEPVEQS
jgi:hypothetical protein